MYLSNILLSLSVLCVYVKALARIILVLLDSLRYFQPPGNCRVSKNFRRIPGYLVLGENIRQRKTP
jgi:hypothetical protein